MLWLCPASAENTPGLLPPYFGLEMAEQIWKSLHTHHKTCGFICIYIPIYILFAGQVRAATDLDTNHRKSTLDGDSWNINLGKIKAFNSFFHHEFVQCCFCSCVCVCVLFIFHNKEHYVSLVFWSPFSNICFLIDRGEMLSLIRFLKDTPFTFISYFCQ